MIDLTAGQSARLWHAIHGNTNRLHICFLILPLSLFACGEGLVNNSPIGQPRDDGGNTLLDGGIVDMAPNNLNDCEDPVQNCGDLCCASGDICRFDRCVPDIVCDNDDQCQGDSFCHESSGECIPFGAPPFPPVHEQCTQVFAAGIFSPALQCEWTGPPAGDSHPDHRNVLGTPVVIDFDFDNDPSTRHPSIAFVSYNGTDGGSKADRGDNGFYGVIRVIDGQTCEEQYEISLVPIVAAPPLAVGDLDGDGRAEIVAKRVGDKLVAFQYNETTDSFEIYWEKSSTKLVNARMWSGPSIHDLDDDGVPEVMIGGIVFDAQPGTTTAISESLGTIHSAHSVFSDIDSDGAADLIFDRAHYEWNAETEDWVTISSGLGAGSGSTSAAGVRSALADFGSFGVNAVEDNRAVLDGIPEIVYVENGKVDISTLLGRTVFGPIDIPILTPSSRSNHGGPPTVADFDGDGRAEVGVAGLGAYIVADPDCHADAMSETCFTEATDGVLWANPTQDFSSSKTGSSVFDFEGDGRAEVVYGDECFARVYDGQTGDVVFSHFRSSCTWLENPVIADVDGDFNSEIVITSNNNCNVSCPSLDAQFSGLRCLEDSECPSATTCVVENEDDAFGFCRCTLDEDCGDSSYVCTDPIEGPSANGKVCRATHMGKRQGIRVLRDALDRWVDSRPIWNQHVYTVTNTDDVGTIPRTSEWQPNWTQPGLNNFRQNIIGDPERQTSPDLTTAPARLTCGASRSVKLEASICNRGTGPIAAGIPLAIYHGDRDPEELICTVDSTTVLQPGTCEVVGCTWSDAKEENVFFVVDDRGDGAERGENSECYEGNNLAKVAVTCPVVLK